MAVRRSQGVRRRQLAEKVAWPLKQVLANDELRCAVHEIPVVNAVVAAEIEVKQLMAASIGDLLAPCLFVHDAASAGADLVNGALQQLLDLCRLHVDERLREREHLTNPDAHELVALALLAGR